LIGKLPIANCRLEGVQVEQVVTEGFFGLSLKTNTQVGNRKLAIGNVSLVG
jgi:hypothetical protein